MKKLLLLFSLLGMFAVPAFAAEGIAVVVNGEPWDWAEKGVRHIFDGNSRRIFAARWMAGQCGITEQSGAEGLALAQAIAENAGLCLRWNGDTKTAYFADKERILYENDEFGIGVLLPEGVENGYTILGVEIASEGQAGRHFVADFCWDGHILFYLTYFDLDYWENEVRENFPISYSEVYRDQNGIWLCENVSDVQVAPDDKKQKAEYERQLSYKEEICDSFYTFTQ